MEVNYLSVLVLGFLLGIKHAVEPDHIIAVSTIAGQSKKLWQSTLSGVFWGIGHTATLFIFGIIVIMIKGEIPNTWAMSLEFLVGIMLVYLGIKNIFSCRNTHIHKKEHKGNVHMHSQKRAKNAYIKSMIIGLVHGLAGSAAMILLTMSTVENIWEAAIYILVFGVGTITGMLLFTTILGIPFVLSAKKKNINNIFIQINGAISTVFGTYYIYNLGIVEGLFHQWI